MAGYVYKPRQIELWDPLAQATIWRQSYEHEQTQTAYWKARCLAAEETLTAIIPADIFELTGENKEAA